MGLDTMKQPESLQEGKENLEKNKKQEFYRMMEEHKKIMGNEVYKILNETELGNKPDLKKKTEDNINKIHKEALEKAGKNYNF